MESHTRSKCPNKGEKKRTTSSPTKHFEELKKGTRSHSSTDRWLATEAKSSEQGWFARRQPDLQLQASEQGVEAPRIFQNLPVGPPFVRLWV